MYFCRSSAPAGLLRPDQEGRLPRWYRQVFFLMLELIISDGPPGGPSWARWRMFRPREEGLVVCFSPS
jgi:hypothetical protein